MFKSHLPLIGIVISVCLFSVAAIYYPGGTTDSSNSVGYDWAHNFISSLFARKALNGATNPARSVSIPAMFTMCISVGALFKSISARGTSRIHRETIAIGGIGSMVYGFLVVTPMHDLMIHIALSFGVIALVVLLHLLYVGRRSRLFWSGTVCVALLLLSAAMYYGTLFYSLLPVMQKVSLLACVGWLLAVHYAMLRPVTPACRMPDEAVEPTR